MSGKRIRTEVVTLAKHYAQYIHYAWSKIDYIYIYIYIFFFFFYLFLVRPAPLGRFFQAAGLLVLIVFTQPAPASLREHRRCSHSAVPAGTQPALCSRVYQHSAGVSRIKASWPLKIPRNSRKRANKSRTSPPNTAKYAKILPFSCTPGIRKHFLSTPVLPLSHWAVWAQSQFNDSNRVSPK